ncbi:MAG TPA: rhomboid-like protein [Actinocrinis sp.]|nr:rhomboid-like protein [Actinocrinis sp.]
MSHPAVRRLQTLAETVLAYVRSAPGTYAWLAILLVNTIIMDQFDPRFRYHFVLHHSTNLRELSHDPIRVLISSALWLDGGHWWPYLILYSLFHAPVERWLGSARWLLVVVISHVGATYLSQSVVYFNISHGGAPASDAFVPDIGVSYALAGAEGVLAYLITAPWRYFYATALILYYGTSLFGDTDFTELGHFTALLLGFACYPLTRARAGSWDPLLSLRSAWTRLRSN